MKIKNNNCKLDALRQANGKFTSSTAEAGEILLSVHFPGCEIINPDHATSAVFSNPTITPDWDLAYRMISPEVWSVFSFAPYKSSGPDGIFPAELQHGFTLIKDHMLFLLRACMAFSTVPKTKDSCRVVFIPKAGWSDYSDPKAFRPINLSSSFLKT